MTANKDCGQMVVVLITIQLGKKSGVRLLLSSQVTMFFKIIVIIAEASRKKENHYVVAFKCEVTFSNSFIDSEKDFRRIEIKLDFFSCGCCLFDIFIFI